jgi:hypothetical protein
MVNNMQGTDTSAPKLAQKIVILKTLIAKKNQWVDMIELSLQTKQLCESQSYAVHSRIADIRREYPEYKVINKKIGKKSLYKLIDA